MLNRIEILKKDGGELTLPIYDATNFQIKDIQGLDPVKANIVTSNFAHIDGTQFQSSRREMRNLVIKLGIDSFGTGGTVQELRKELYSYLMPKTDVSIRFVRDGLENLIISGQVESFDSPLFVKEPEATISILCFEPDFYSEEIDTLESISVLPYNYTYDEIEYPGEVDSGILFTLYANTTITEFVLENKLPDNSVRQIIFKSLEKPLLSNDILTISTVPGNKYVILTRDGIDTSMLWAIDQTSDWIALYPGINNIRVTSQDYDVPFSIDYVSRFGGL